LSGKGASNATTEALNGCGENTSVPFSNQKNFYSLSQLKNKNTRFYTSADMPLVC
jgi:hypothetical protein